MKKMNFKRVAKEIYDRVRKGENLWKLLDETGMKFVQYPAFLKEYTSQCGLGMSDAIEEVAVNLKNLFGGLKK